MSPETATKAIEMMLAESPGKPKYTLVFFGGEPLSNMGLIRAVVDFAERRFAEVGAWISPHQLTLPCCRDHRLAGRPPRGGPPMDGAACGA